MGDAEFRRVVKRVPPGCHVWDNGIQVWAEPARDGVDAFEPESAHTSEPVYTKPKEEGTP